MTPDRSGPPPPVPTGGTRLSIASAPDSPARRLVAGLAGVPGRRTRRTGPIDVILRSPVSPHALSILCGVEDAAWKLGVDLVLSAEGGRRLDRVRGRGSAGVLLLRTSPTAEEWARLATRDVPVVFVDPRRKPPPGVPVVASANRAGAREAVRHLIGLGHRRIAAITGRPGVPCGVDRLAGYREAMAEAGLTAVTACGYFQTGLARQATLDLLARLPEPPTAILACSDAMALGVYEALAERGLRVPGDVSVIGFDDGPAAAQATPALTTVRQPWQELGAAALSVLLSRSADSVELPATLVVRESACRPRS